MKHLFEIVYAVEPREFARHYQQILKRAEGADGLTLGLYLVKCEGDALQGIGVVESTVNACVGACV